MSSIWCCCSSSGTTTKVQPVRTSKGAGSRSGATRSSSKTGGRPQPQQAQNPVVHQPGTVVDESGHEPLNLYDGSMPNETAHAESAEAPAHQTEDNARTEGEEGDDQDDSTNSADHAHEPDITPESGDADRDQDHDHKENNVKSENDSDRSDSESDARPSCSATAGNIDGTVEPRKGPNEKVLIITCISTAEPRNADALMTVDIDPESPTYCKIISCLHMPNVNDELHHSSWNVCAGRHDEGTSKRTHIILPCLHSSRIYVVNASDPTDLTLHKTIEATAFSELDATFMHTAHCLPSGDIGISSLGDSRGYHKGDIIILDGQTFAVKGRWPDTQKLPKFNAGFCYKKRLNVLISTEWGAPNAIKKGFNMTDVHRSEYGHKIHIWDYTMKKRRQIISFEGRTGWMPMKVRFLHGPAEPHAFVSTALGSAVYHIYLENASAHFYRNDRFQEMDPWQHELAVTIPPKEVKGWILPQMPAMITDIAVSMENKYLYASCWLFGEVRQYDIRDPFNFKLRGRVGFIRTLISWMQVRFGGLLQFDSKIITVTDELDSPDGEAPISFVKGSKIQGGPQKLQLSSDGKRLYVTTSLYSVWDKQFFPDMARHGSQLLKINVDNIGGGMALDDTFIVDFGNAESGPFSPHEMRYPDCDSTTDKSS